MSVQAFGILYKLGLYITTFFTKTRRCMQILIEGWRWLGVQKCNYIDQGNRHVRLEPLLGMGISERLKSLLGTRIGERLRYIC